MAFGLSGAPATFQRLMDRVLGQLKGNGAFVYLDDVVIYSETFEEHVAKLTELLSLLRRVNLKANWAKCTFAAASVTYLGHVISTDGIRPNPALVSAIREYPVPKSVKEVRAFIGLAGYYRRFVKHFAERARPLTQLAGKNARFLWGAEQQRAFDDLREALVGQEVLSYPDFKEPFLLSTDASGVALGAVLSQFRDGQERPVGYASRQLKGAEMNYSATERELLAVVWATKYFRCYLLGRKFRLVTDHAALKWMLSLREPSSRLARWSLRLQEFEYDVEHKPGRKHSNADALSRQVAGVRRGPELNRTNLKQAQESDPWVRELVQKSPCITRDAGGLWYWTKGCEKASGKWRALVPEPLRQRTIAECHDRPWAGHPGIDRTAAIVSRSYYWPGLKKDVEEYVRRCELCAQRKTPSGLAVPLEAPYIATGPFDQVSMDIVGPFPRSPRGNRYLLTLIDHFTRYAEAIPLREQTAEETARALVQNIITRHGPPRRLLTDQGRNFVSQLFKETCRLLGIHKIQTTAYHPESNGMVERLHRTLTDAVSHFARRDGRDWDRWIPYALMAYRATPHSSTGYSPNFLLYGREIPPPVARTDPILEIQDGSIEQLADRLRVAHEEAQKRAEKAWANRTEYCNRGRQERSFQAGDWVYLREPAIRPGHFPKFHRPWTGPHQVVTRMSRVTYRIRKANGVLVVVHVNRLKKAFREGSIDGHSVGESESPELEEEDHEPLFELSPGTPIDLEMEESGVMPRLEHDNCPVSAGASPACPDPSCPLGGQFSLPPSGSTTPEKRSSCKTPPQESGRSHDSAEEVAELTEGGGDLRINPVAHSPNPERESLLASSLENEPPIRDRTEESWRPPRPVAIQPREPYLLRPRRQAREDRVQGRGRGQPSLEEGTQAPEEGWEHSYHHD